MVGIDIQHVPYKGAGQAVTDLLGGHVDSAFVSLASVVPQIKAQRLKALGVTSAKRSALMPDLPTFIEGGLPGYDVTGSFGVLAPAASPREIIDRLHTDLKRALAQPELAHALITSGIEPAVSSSPEEFTSFLRAEIAKWAKVVKASGASVQ
jgi:tripartite-type tricarboxylate transporter receptor subunit TctC